MSDMLTRVADAIAAADDKTSDYRDLARAALGALREPTREMLVSGIMAIDNAVDTTTDTNETYVYTTGADYALPGWRAMIDAALRDSGSDRNGEDSEAG